MGAHVFRRLVPVEALAHEKEAHLLWQHVFALAVGIEHLHVVNMMHTHHQ